jgi:hypothetical protein
LDHRALSEGDVRSLEQVVLRVRELRQNGTAARGHLVALLGGLVAGIQVLCKTKQNGNDGLLDGQDGQDKSYLMEIPADCKASAIDLESKGGCIQSNRRVQALIIGICPDNLLLA